MQNPTKHCRKCDEVKPLAAFTRAKASTNYRSSNATHHGYCKACNAAAAREWRKTHPGYRGSGALKKVPQEDRLLMSAIRSRISDAKHRAGSVTVTPDEAYEIFLQQDRKCALTGAVLSLEKDHPLCLSLDQIEPGKGYNVGNIQWLAWCVNRAKGDLSLDQFYEMCEVVIKQKEQRLSKGAARRTE